LCELAVLNQASKAFESLPWALLAPGDSFASFRPWCFGYPIAPNSQRYCNLQSRHIAYNLHGFSHPSQPS
jgi:hypothetical protein